MKNLMFLSFLAVMVCGTLHATYATNWANRPLHVRNITVEVSDSDPGVIPDLSNASIWTPGSGLKMSRTASLRDALGGALLRHREDSMLQHPLFNKGNDPSKLFLEVVGFRSIIPIPGGEFLSFEQGFSSESNPEILTQSATESGWDRILERVGSSAPTNIIIVSIRRIEALLALSS